MILASLLTTSACIPPEPKLDYCQVSIPDNETYCSNGEIDHTIQITQMDKFICVSQDDFIRGRKYITELKKALAECKAK